MVLYTIKVDDGVISCTTEVEDDDDDNNYDGEEEEGAGDAQTSHFFLGFMGLSFGQLKSLENSLLFITVPCVRYPPGVWVSFGRRRNITFR